MSASSGFRKVRAGVVATCIAAVVFTGATYGAGLKTQQEWTEKRNEFRASPLEEQIAVLETQRTHLAAQRETIREKMRKFDKLSQERKAAEVERKAAEEERKAAKVVWDENSPSSP